MNPVRHQSGIALLEALLAILLLSIGIIGTIGMQGRAYAALNDATERAEATLAAERLLGVMHNDLANLDSYALAASGTPAPALLPWYQATTAAIPHAAITVAVTPLAGTTRSRVDIRISWRRRAGEALNTHAITAYLAQAS